MQPVPPPHIFESRSFCEKYLSGGTTLDLDSIHLAQSPTVSHSANPRYLLAPLQTIFGFVDVGRGRNVLLHKIRQRVRRLPMHPFLACGMELHQS
jgi:hypothetical protein